MIPPLPVLHKQTNKQEKKKKNNPSPQNIKMLLCANGKLLTQEMIGFQTLS